MPGSRTAVSTARAKANPSLEFTRGELEAFLDGLDTRGPVRADEITADQFAARRGIGYYAAQRALAGQVKAGKMVKRQATLDGHPCIAYSLKK